MQKSRPELHRCLPVFESIACDSRQTASKGVCVWFCLRGACVPAFFFCMRAPLSDTEVSRQIHGPAETYGFTEHTASPASRTPRKRGERNKPQKTKTGCKDDHFYLFLSFLTCHAPTLCSCGVMNNRGVLVLPRSPS